MSVGQNPGLVGLCIVTTDVSSPECSKGVPGFLYVPQMAYRVKPGKMAEYVSRETFSKGHFTGGFANQSLHPAKLEKKQRESVYISLKSQPYKPKNPMFQILKWALL